MSKTALFATATEEEVQDGIKVDKEPQTIETLNSTSPLQNIYDFDNCRHGIKIFMEHRYFLKNP